MLFHHVRLCSATDRIWHLNNEHTTVAFLSSNERFRFTAQYSSPREVRKPLQLDGANLISRARCALVNPTGSDKDKVCCNSDEANIHVFRTASSGMVLKVTKCI